MTGADAPYHAHVYYSDAERLTAEELRDRLQDMAQDGPVLFVGRMTDGPVGPHPIPQFEVHFLAKDRPAVVAAIADSTLRALVHPLTDDDLADHTTLGDWIAQPVALDVSALDPPGVNQGLGRFGKTDF